jgi:hypothetical protein
MSPDREVERLAWLIADYPRIVPWGGKEGLTGTKDDLDTVRATDSKLAGQHITGMDGQWQRRVRSVARQRRR